MKVIKLTERDLRNIVKRVISESEGAEETTESKPRCLTTNTMSLDEINGDSDSFRPYSDSINKRNGGVTGIILRDVGIRAGSALLALVTDDLAAAVMAAAAAAVAAASLVSKIRILSG